MSLHSSQLILDTRSEFDDTPINKLITNNYGAAVVFFIKKIRDMDYKWTLGLISEYKHFIKKWHRNKDIFNILNNFEMKTTKRNKIYYMQKKPKELEMHLIEIEDSDKEKYEVEEDEEEEEYESQGITKRRMKKRK